MATGGLAAVATLLFTPPPPPVKLRLQRYLAQAGASSRRGGEVLILAGRVHVNGRPVTELGTKVEPTDTVSLDGKVLKIRRSLMVALNKPPGYVCTRRDEASRKVVGDLLPSEWSDLYPVGRLDRDTEGLLFLTNDGDFCLRMTHPRFGVRKRYLARVKGRLTESILRQLLRGVEHRGERLRAVRALLLEANASHSLAELDLVEGKNHEVRRMFEALGFPVDRLRRTHIGPIGLGELPPGKWRTLTREEIATLRRLTAASADAGAKAKARPKGGGVGNR